MKTRGMLLLTASVALALAAPSPADDPPATRTVRRLDEALLGVLREADRLGYQGRVDRLAPVVAESYDIPFMAEKSLGQHWKTLDETGRKRWIDLSLRFSVANYAANFDHDSGQTIDLLGEEAGPADTAIVRTRINDPKGEAVEMTYRLRPDAGGWKIVDVYLKGTVSELALRRADYTAVLEREGFEGLARTMEGKIADLAAGRARR